MIRWFLFSISYLLVAFGQPCWFGWLSPLSAACGFALFWTGLMQTESRLGRFALASVWFTAVQMIQLSWMTSIEFQGIYILIVYAWLASWLGVQFGLLSLLLPRQGMINGMRMLAIASLWVLFEWSRFYFLCGFSWNPTGIFLGKNLYSLQLATLGGVLGLSFWVMLVNASMFNVLRDIKNRRLPTLKNGLIWALLAAFPYLFGVLHLTYHKRLFLNEPAGRNLTVAMVQTGLLPPQKLVLPERLHAFVSPWDQWRRILTFLKPLNKTPLDLIAFPEVALPFQCDKAIYSYESVLQILVDELGKDVLKVLPPLHPPYAEKKRIDKKDQWMVSNSFWSQVLSNYFHAEIVMGLEDEERESKKSYNAAFHFSPKDTAIRRYEKRVLLPLAEYLPMNWLLPLVEKYGIRDVYTKGSGAKVFKGIVPLSISICYEETFPDLIREGRLLGAELLVNVTNDNWYPNSRLPQQHFDLGRLRAVENGMPLLRACNTGVSAAIDSLGRPICTMGELDEKSQWRSGALLATLPLYHYKTLYTFWGDGGVVGLSFILMGIFWRGRSFLKLG
ncbi:MAG: apolipoprotein N-acyltransferase [Chlamydiales bacterium]